MTAQEKIAAETATAVGLNVHSALAMAQAEMSPPVRNSENNAFSRGNKKSMYADLDSVVESVRVPLTRHGLSWRHEMQRDGNEWVMITHIDHGESGTHISCPVPMLVDKQNMHGLKSAATYAKRIGLESVTGQAPGDDDDGNYAADNARVAEPERRDVPPEVISAISGAATLASLKTVWDANREWQIFPKFQEAKNNRKAALEQAQAAAPDNSDIQDEIPY